MRQYGPRGPGGGLGPLVLVLALALLAGPARAGDPGLAVWRGGGWRTFWRAGSAPARWTAPETTLARAARWLPVADGVERAELRLAAPGPAWRTRLVLARLDPRRVALSLELAVTPDLARADWSIERAPADAIVAVNAGQFARSLPWGWLVLGGRERLAPGAGPLALACAVDARGGVSWLPADSLAAGAGARLAPRYALAFQSYPALLEPAGRVPEALRAPGRGVDLTHRDTRLALGELRDGRLVIALTRFDALGEVAGGAPIGLTTPEMAAVMGALGCRAAVMLDGGISAQLLVREPATGRRWAWPGHRRVPLGLVARPR